jgi:hypothetical protein
LWVLVTFDLLSAYFQNPLAVTNEVAAQNRADGWRHRPALVTGTQFDTLAVSAMVALFVVLHGVWFTRTPGDLDAFNFVLGVRDFDVAQHRPHPPGAPVYIATGKVATWLWRGLGLPADSLAGPESAALGGLTLIAGSLSIVLVWRILRRLDGPSIRTRRATLIIASAPLLWMLSGRRVSDAMGLLLVLSAGLLMMRGQLHLASLLSGIGMGLRLQTTLLTIPALLICLARTRCRKTAAAACGWFTAGIALWLLPLLVTTGGAKNYWLALTAQAEDDLSNPVVLAGAPTFQHATDALINTLVRPWGAPLLAAVILIAALAGAIRLQRTSARRTSSLVLCATPYVLFHLAFHETATIRYALPVVLGVAYLAAVAVEVVPHRWRGAAIVLLVGANLFVSVRMVQAYSRDDTPAMALLRAMYRHASVEPPAFVTGHSSMMLPRLQQLLESPPWQAVSPPALYEWQSTIEHWSRGGTAPVWFIADPRRTDMSLVDRRSQHMLGSFRLNVQATWILNGLRPKAITWWELRPPAWIAVKGFALTPEVGGLAARDRQGPAFDGAVALVRRSPTGAVLVVGGRHLGPADDPPVRVVIEVDGQAVTSVVANAQERHYVLMAHLRHDQLKGDTPYATVTIRSTSLAATAGVVPVSVEQFDYQPDEGVLFAFASGWHEPELRPGTGITWRWASRRATVRVHRRPGTAVELRLSGDVPATRRARSAEIRVTSADDVLDAFAGAPAFSRRVAVPGSASDACDIDIIVDSTFSFVPYDEGQRADRRELAFRAFDLGVDPLTVSR